MDTHNPITENLKKNSFNNSFFNPNESNEKPPQPTESDLSFDLNSIDLEDLSTENQSNHSSNVDDEEASCCCMVFWRRLCSKR